MALAFLRRQIFEPAHGYLTRSPKLRYWKELEKTQFFTEDQLREIQWRRLQELLNFVWDNNDFHRRRFQRAGLTPDAITCIDDIRKLPILTKADIRANTPALISRGFDQETLQRAKTGGSTGKSLELFFTEECSELRNACARRHDRWSGWEPGEPIAACWGNPKLPKTLKEKLKAQLLSPFLYLDTMQVDEKAVRDFVREWARVKPTLLYGHAHSIFILAEFLRKLDIRPSPPRGILSTSMMLIPSERRVIEAVFNVKVTDRYGCEEVGLIGSECEMHNGMHLNIEHLVVEFVKDDGSHAKAGETGKIIVTDLMNHAMPMIRYQVEDMGVPTDRKCSCGRGLPLMDQVAGRVADFLVKQDGAKVAGISLIENTLTHFPGLDQMQIVQQSYDSFLLRVVPGAAFSEEISDQLREYMKKVFGESAHVEVALVDAIQPEKSGKYRFSICRVS